MVRQDNTNEVTIIGEVVESLNYHHTVMGEQFFQMRVATKRYSGVMDVLPVIVSEYLLQGWKPEIGSRVFVEGEYRSWDKVDEGKRRLILFVFATALEAVDENQEDRNDVMLQGYVTSQVMHRKTPGGKILADILLSVQRGYRKSSYIPVIVWGRMAMKAERYVQGTMVTVCGRLQSREYLKCLDNGETEMRIAYEVSASYIIDADGTGGDYVSRKFAEQAKRSQ